VEIMAFDGRQAREIAEAIRYLAANGKPKDKVWSDKQAALTSITDNIKDIKSEGKEVKQSIEMINNDPCKISVKVSRTDDKGKTTDQIFESALTDMNRQMVELKVSGKTVEVILPCKNKGKLVKAYKNGEQQAWGAEVKIGTDDVETARNIAEAFKSAIAQ
jgi:predicted  nucleic acid-binding Zn-ribbon protein